MYGYVSISETPQPLQCKRHVVKVGASVVQGHDFLNLRLVAVSGRQHPLAGDERAAAEVVASVQGHLVGHRVRRALVASDHAVISRWRSH